MSPPEPGGFPGRPGGFPGRPGGFPGRPGGFPGRPGGRTGPQITGHRGAAGLAAENTVAGFKLAADLGCDCVELDVHLTADGQLAVIHDAQVDRTTNGSGSVAGMTLANLQTLDAGRGNRIPSLQEVLDLLAPTGLRAQIELKGPGTQNAVCDLLAARAATPVRLTSFYHRRVLATADRLPDAQRGVLISCYPVDPVGIARAARAQILHVRAKFLDAALVREVQDAGLEVAAFGVPDNPDEMDRLLLLGVDHLGANRPDLALQRRAALALPMRTARSRPGGS